MTIITLTKFTTNLQHVIDDLYNHKIFSIFEFPQEMILCFILQVSVDWLKGIPRYVWLGKVWWYKIYVLLEVRPSNKGLHIKHYMVVLSMSLFSRSETPSPSGLGRESTDPSICFSLLVMIAIPRWPLPTFRHVLWYLSIAFVYSTCLDAICHR